jgi:hypothetical protein
MLAFFICGFFAAPLTADENLVRFKGGIGAIPVRGNVAPFAVNTVLGVNPGGQPWVISDLDATVKVNGDIKVDGRGLLLGGGNNIGTNTPGKACAPGSSAPELRMTPVWYPSRQTETSRSKTFSALCRPTHAAARCF